MAIGNRQIHVRMRIYRPGSTVDFVDVTPWLSRAEVNLGDVSSVGTGSSGGDGVARQMLFTLRQDVANRFSPLDDVSLFNWYGAEFAPLLFANREVTLEVALTPPNQPPISWRLLFHGLLGDSIRLDGELIEVECRDLSKRLQDRYISEPREYGAPVDEGGVRADIVIQQIIDDEFGPGQITVHVPSTPAFFCPPFLVEYQSVWDAIQSVVAEFGWFLGYLYDDVTGSFRLTLIEPPRGKGPTESDFDFTAEDDIYMHDLDITDRNVRNSVVVVYRDESGQRQTVTAEDTDSINEFGLRPMQIDEANSMLIKTAPQAQVLANFAVQDLANLRSTTMLELPFVPDVDVFAGITVDDPRISTEVLFYGVDSVRHTLDFESGLFGTEVIGSGQVLGSYQRWLQMQTRRGSDGRPPFDVWPVRPNTTITVAAADSENEAKRRADIVCNGRNDQRDIMLALSRIPGGGKVALAEGTYYIESPIVINHDRQLIEGAGPGTVIRVADGLNAPGGGLPMVEVPILVGVASGLRNLTLDGNKDNTTGDIHGLFMAEDAGHDFTVESVRMVDFSGHAIWLVAGGPAIIADGLWVEGCEQEAVLIEGAEATIRNSRLQGSLDSLNTGEHGVAVVGGGFLTVENTEISGFGGYGVLSEQGVLTVRGGLIEFSGAGHIRITDGFRIVIDGVRIDETFTGHAIEIIGEGPVFSAEDIRISNCEISFPAETGIRLNREAGAAIIRGVEITNCVVHGAGAQGLFWRGCEQVKIEGCTITDSITQGLNAVQVSRLRLIGNEIRGSGLDGMLAQELNHSIITGNSFIENGRHGLSLSDFDGSGIPSSHNEITENLFEANSQEAHNTHTGLRLFDPTKANNVQSNIIRRGTLANQQRYGIWVSSGAQDNLVTNNDLYEAGVDDDFRNDSPSTITTAGNRMTAGVTGFGGGFRVRRDSNFDFSAGVSVLEWNVVDLDTDGMHPSPGTLSPTLTCQVAGLYQLTCSIRVNPAVINNNQTYRFRIKVNAFTVVEEYASAIGTVNDFPRSFMVTTAYPLLVGDQISVEIERTGAANPNTIVAVSTISPVFAGIRVG